MLVVGYLLNIPRAPALVASDASKTLIENYKAMSDVALDRAVQLFDAVVVKTLLPGFTGITGFIFGTQSRGR